MSLQGEPLLCPVCGGQLMMRRTGCVTRVPLMKVPAVEDGKKQVLEDRENLEHVLVDDQDIVCSGGCGWSPVFEGDDLDAWAGGAELCPHGCGCLKTAGSGFHDLFCPENDKGNT
jgi:hypothetical protein